MSRKKPSKQGPGKRGHGERRGDGKGLRETVKTARRRKAGSTRWLERQLNDPYVRQAQRQGYRSRAAFKLRQLDEKCGLLRPGARGGALGAAAGGWSQVLVEKIKPQETGGQIVGIDYLAMEPVAGADLILLDFLEGTAPVQLREALGGLADIVLSDMAAPTTGHAKTDHLRIMSLAETAYAFAAEVLAPGGAFVCKLFQGGAEKSLLDPLKADFDSVKHVKPDASRADSAELYIVAQGFRGG